LWATLVVRRRVSDKCVRCKLETPLHGYICEWCTMEEYQRIRRLPESEWGVAQDRFDREKLGFVPTRPSPQEAMIEIGEKLRKLGEHWRSLGVDLELPDV